MASNLRQDTERLDVLPGDRFLLDDQDRRADRSNFVAFLLGGVVIAGGLLGFLYFDSNNLTGADISTTGSLGRYEVPATLPATSPSAPTR